MQNTDKPEPNLPARVPPLPESRGPQANVREEAGRRSVTSGSATLGCSYSCWLDVDALANCASIAFISA
jgi:hypothetical protein